MILSRNVTWVDLLSPLIFWKIQNLFLLDDSDEAQGLPPPDWIRLLFDMKDIDSVLRRCSRDKESVKAGWLVNWQRLHIPSQFTALLYPHPFRVRLLWNCKSERSSWWNNYRSTQAAVQSFLPLTPDGKSYFVLETF